MGVTTKTGDKGQTRLFTGESIAKDDLRVETYGTIDQLTSVIGMARAFATNQRVKDDLFAVQKQLGMLMADFASRGQKPMITEEMVQEIEAEISSIEGSLPPLTKFLVPGETQAETFLDFARTTARMAERRAWSLSRRGTVEDVDLRYLNRLSDYMFILMRLENQDIPKR